MWALRSADAESACRRNKRRRKAQPPDKGSILGYHSQEGERPRVVPRPNYWSQKHERENAQTKSPDRFKTPRPGKQANGDDDCDSQPDDSRTVHECSGAAVVSEGVSDMREGQADSGDGIKPRNDRASAEQGADPSPAQLGGGSDRGHQRHGEADGQEGLGKLAAEDLAPHPTRPTR